MAEAYIIFGRNGSGSGTGGANDSFADSFEIFDASTTVFGNNDGFTGEPGEPEQSGGGTTSAWWSWTAPADAGVVVDTVGKRF